MAQPHRSDADSYCEDPHPIPLVHASLSRARDITNAMRTESSEPRTCRTWSLAQQAQWQVISGTSRDIRVSEGPWIMK